MASRPCHITTSLGITACGGSRSDRAAPAASLTERMVVHPEEQASLRTIVGQHLVTPRLDLLGHCRLEHRALRCNSRLLTGRLARRYLDGRLRLEAVVRTLSCLSDRRMTQIHSTA